MQTLLCSMTKMDPKLDVHCPWRLFRNHLVHLVWVNFLRIYPKTLLHLDFVLNFLANDRAWDLQKKICAAYLLLKLTHFPLDQLLSTVALRREHTPWWLWWQLTRQLHWPFRYWPRSCQLGGPLKWSRFFLTSWLSPHTSWGGSQNHYPGSYAKTK